MAQDGSLQAGQVDAGVDAELVAQQHPGSLERPERLGLAARPVQADHELLPPSLAQRLVGDEVLEGGDGRGPELELRVRADLEGQVAQLLEPAPLEDRRWPLAELVVGTPPPSVHGGSQELQAVLRRHRGRPGTHPCECVLEGIGIAGHVDAREEVAAGAGLDGVGADDLAQAHHVGLQRAGVAHDIARPERLPQDFVGDHLIELERQRGEQGPLPGPRQGVAAGCAAHHQGSEHPELHVRTVAGAPNRDARRGPGASAQLPGHALLVMIFGLIPPRRVWA